jgi:exodeoxyribonuclease-5
MTIPVLCSTHRLARSLRLAYDRQQAAKGLTQWQPLPARTLAQWLEETITQSMLTGEIPSDTLPLRVLDGMAERLLWEEAISQSLADDAAEALFDVAGMAQSAAEANSLMLGWGLFPPSSEHSEEARQFLRWRTAFHKLCHGHHAMESARLFNLYTDCLERGAATLPPHIELAGFDRVSPQEQRLFDVLAARGVGVTHHTLGPDRPAVSKQAAYDDAEAECRAAAAWAANKLAQNPQARLAIVTPELGPLRARLSSILDDTLQPQTIHPAHAETPRCYDFSLGEPLAAKPIIATALALLRLAVRRYRVSQQDIGWLLRDIHWSAGASEADARARLEARMRRKLGSTLHLEQLLRLARKAQQEGLGVVQLIRNLEALNADADAWPKKQFPSAWSSAFVDLLKAAGWPGERSLSSHEFQARKSWQEVLESFSALDPLLGKVDAAEALSRFSGLCQEHIFQPEAEGEPQLLVMGMLETAGATLDAIWVMGMNDHIWPPPARPNPLLPVELQRMAGIPNSCSRVQAEFAQAIYWRLLHSAPEVVFSWSHKDGERELRPSPLLNEIPLWDAPVAPAATLAEQLAQPAEMQWLEDHRAPPVADGEAVHGGTGLLKAQAICPAWAYYQYRLGARALEEPVEGLDAMARGSLLHEVLACFWNGRGLADLHAMDESSLDEAVALAVEQGILEYSRQLEESLPIQLAALEKLRLQFLVMAWLEFEKAREPFMVQECERRHSMQIEGLQVNLVLDRVDELPDGRLVVLDYKTGANVSHKSWAEDRITEPQLPIYAALALSGEEVAAVCFARVRPDEQKFIGIAAGSDLLPDVKGLEDVRKLFPEDRFPDWAALIHHWKTSIQAIALEIKAGDAAVRFENEDDLRDCDVKPLLRLPERKLQMERGRE